MALFSDGILSSIEDLRAYESSILETAQTEGIDLLVKLQLAQQEISNLIYQFLVDQTASEALSPSLTLDQIAITNALSEWHALHTILIVMRDCYHNQLNDRYQGKWNEYRKRAEESSIRYFDVGVGIVRNPVPKATRPTVTTIPGELVNGTYEICVTWQTRNGEEGSASEIVVFESLDGSVPVVHTEKSPMDGASWNVYLAVGGNPLVKQNESALSFSEDWTMSTNEVSAGQVLGKGQSPDLFLRRIHRLRRA